jgi:hypothetical protein
MKTTTIVIYLALTILLLIENTTAQSLMDSLSMYYPLKIGNVWKYQYKSFSRTSGPDEYVWERTIIGDTLIEGNTNSIIQDIRKGVSTIWYARFDFTTGNYYVGNSIRDSTAAISGWYKWGPVVTYKLSLFGIKTTGRSVGDIKHAWGIGYYEYQLALTGWNSIETLIYAKINGIEYKSLTNVSQNDIEKSYQYSLDQNYPNPFNPSTTITFSIPTHSFVTLKIYDLIGREIATIVSGELLQGRYTKQWNANNLPNGVYYCRLQAGVFTSSRKLVLLK